MKYLSIALAICAPALANAGTNCFTVYDAADVVIYRSRTPPIDLSKTISAAMAEKYPGHHLVWTHDDTSCPELRSPASGSGGLVNRFVAPGGGQLAFVASPMQGSPDNATAGGPGRAAPVRRR